MERSTNARGKHSLADPRNPIEVWVERSIEGLEAEWRLIANVMNDNSAHLRTARLRSTSFRGIGGSR